MPAFVPALPDLRAQLEAQVDFLHQVLRHTVDTLEQVSDLNLHMLRRQLDDGMEAGARSPRAATLPGWVRWQCAAFRPRPTPGAPGQARA